MAIAALVMREILSAVRRDSPNGVVRRVCERPAIPADVPALDVPVQVRPADLAPIALPNANLACAEAVPLAACASGDVLVLAGDLISIEAPVLVADGALVVSPVSVNTLSLVVDLDLSRALSPALGKVSLERLVVHWVLVDVLVLAGGLVFAEALALAPASPA
jgi:hypothetical protein